MDGRFTDIVPCGHCIKCLQRRQNAWAFRLEQELKVSTSAMFLTLTYENAPKSFNGIDTLDKRDFQKFMKRLRKKLQYDNTVNKTKIKYYACGEYGDKTERPHYHAIVFNLPRPFEKFLLKAWKLGHIHIGTVTEASIFYTTKYALKGLRRKKAWDYDELGREPEFQLMSNGLGISYNKEPIIDYLRTNGTELLTMQGGVKKTLPRYYIEKMFTDPTELSLWRASATAESSSHHRNAEELTDKQRTELISLHEYRNERDKIRKAGDI